MNILTQAHDEISILEVVPPCFDRFLVEIVRDLGWVQKGFYKSVKRSPTVIPITSIAELSSLPLNPCIYRKAP